MNIIYLDTETTGNNGQDRLVQVAYKSKTTNEVVNEYFKPPVPISIGAMAVHHITNEMVEKKPLFHESEHYEKLKHILADAIVVAHNAPFDIGILKNEGMDVVHSIDTLRVARHLIESDQYSLQYLRYLLKLNIEGSAHDALGDILVLEALFRHLMNEAGEKYTLSEEEDIVKKIIELSDTPVLLSSIRFGKYKGKTFEEVARVDRGYLDWLYGSESQKKPDEQNAELIHTLKHFLGKN